MRQDCVRSERCDDCGQPAVARYHDLPLCGACAARTMLRHLQTVGQLRARLSEDASQVETESGDCIVPVTRWWRWKQPVYVPGQWAILTQVVCHDEAGTKYTGRGKPGRLILLKKQPHPKRLREKLA